jgi:hypothetical protein
VFRPKRAAIDVQHLLAEFLGLREFTVSPGLFEAGAAVNYPQRPMFG